MTRLPYLLVLAVVLSITTSCVTMGKYHAMQDRVATVKQNNEQLVEKLATLEQRIDNLKELSRKEESAIRERVADLAADFAEFQMTLGTIQGRQEEIDFKLKAVAKHVTGLKGLVEDRFGVDSDALPKDLPKTAKEFFKLGMSSQGSGLNRKARAIFRAFLKTFPDDERADNAQYMIGETLFAEGRFTEAVNAYKTVYDQYQTGDMYKQAVLRIGLAYVRSNKCKKAVKIYKFAQKTFKGEPEAEAAAKEIKELKKVCK